MRDSQSTPKWLDQLSTVGSTIAAIAATALLGSDLLFDWSSSDQRSPYLPMLIATALAGAAAILSLEVARAARSRAKSRQIFIVHAQQDLSVARDIGHLLKANGFSPWISEDAVLPGQVWQEATLTALKQSSAAVILVSESFINSTSAQMEADLAIRNLASANAKSTPIIPMRLDNVPMPEPFRNIREVDLQTEDAFDRLLKGLKAATRPS